MPLLLRVAIFLGAVLVVLTVMLFVFAQMVRQTSMFFPDKFPNGDWTTTASDVTFKTDDGLQLHGWLYRAAGEHAPLLVWMHGNGGNITERAPMAAELANRGVSVLLFDWRGYGKSEGTPSEDALYHDAPANRSAGRMPPTPPPAAPCVVWSSRTPSPPLQHSATPSTTRSRSAGSRRAP